MSLLLKNLIFLKAVYDMRVLVDAVVASLERSLRVVLPIIVFLVYIRRKAIGIEFTFGSVSPYIEELILCATVVWVIFALYLSKALTFKKCQFKKTFDKLMHDKIKKKTSYSTIVHITSAMIQYVGVLVVGFLLGHYHMLMIVVLVTVLFLLAFMCSPNLTLAVHRLGPSRSQLIFFLIVIFFIVIFEHLHYIYIDFGLLILLYSLRFSLLYFVHFLVYLSIYINSFILSPDHTISKHTELD